MFLKKILREVLRARDLSERGAVFSWFGVWEFELRERNGVLISKWESMNALALEGRKNMLDSYLAATNTPTTFYLGLVNDTPVKGDTVADLLDEPSTHGYARQEITRDATGWPTVALDSGDWMYTSKQVTFQATGGSWGPVTYAFLTNVASGTGGLLIAFVALSTSPKTLMDGQTLNAKMKIKLKDPA